MEPTSTTNSMYNSIVNNLNYNTMVETFNNTSLLLKSSLKNATGFSPFFENCKYRDNLSCFSRGFINAPLESIVSSTSTIGLGLLVLTVGAKKALGAESYWQKAKWGTFAILGAGVAINHATQMFNQTLDISQIQCADAWRIWDNNDGWYSMNSGN